MARDFHVKNLPKYQPLEAAYRWPKAKHIHHGRTKNSHKGISKLQHLKSLSAMMVNQSYIDEICELKNLTHLSISIATAENFDGLANLKKLRFLKIEYAHRNHDFLFVRHLPNLEGLYFEHLKQLSDYSFLAGVNSIKRLGIGGATNGTKQTVLSLEPIGKMQGLEELYMSIVTLKDKNLTYLAECPKLKVFECGRMAPKKSFRALRDVLPELECKYYDWAER